MLRSLALLVVTCLAGPGIASAQIDMDAAQPPASPPPLQLFKDTIPEPGGRSIEAIETPSWWEAPRRNTEIPRWTIGHTVAVNAPGGLALSAGVFGRRADPLPLFLSQGAAPGTQRLASNSVTDPTTHRLRLDATFGITASLRNTPRLKLNAIGELFLPLTSPKDPSPAFLPSRAFRLGIGTDF
jgi:hypothetical protein